MLPIVLAVSLAGLIFGTITDLKSREVPDFVNYSLIFAGFGIALISTFHFQNPMILIESILGFGFLFAIACLMYYTGQWGGGDSKMIMGLGALIGLPWPISGWIIEVPFLIRFIIFSIIAGAAYGLIWSLSLAIINRRKFMPKLAEILGGKKFTRIKVMALIFAGICLIASLFIPGYLRIIILTLALITVFSVYMYGFIKTVEEVCMIKDYTPDMLTEGDWIIHEVKVGKRVIVSEKNLGVEKDQIEEMIKLAKKGKIKTVKVKEGIPFVPSFLMAFIASMFITDILFLI